jgi:hypothetical protein
MAFVLPSRREVGVLSPDIAGEGVKVMLSDGDIVSFNPPAAKPVIPDMSGIKAIAHYFNRTGYRVFPAWLYHPTEEPRVVKDANEAADLGVCYREASIDERGRYGRDHVWDWKDECLWRPQPYEGTLKFDPLKAAQGKEYIRSPANPVVAQNELVAMLIPQVAAAVASALKANGPAAPSTVDPAQWDQFLQFQAWQKTKDVVETVLQPEADPAAMKTLTDYVPIEDEAESPALTNLTPDQERTLWVAEAERKGIKVDGRWNLDRLKSEVQKAA